MSDVRRLARSFGERDGEVLGLAAQLGLKPIHQMGQTSRPSRSMKGKRGLPACRRWKYLHPRDLTKSRSGT